MAPLARRRGQRTFGPLVLAGLALVLLPSLSCGTGEPGAESVRIAPDFTLPVLGGGEMDLASLRGKTVVVDFWATWCAPCVHQIPILNAFQSAHEGEAVVLGVSVDTAGEDVVGAFADEHEVSYPVLLGDADLARRYGALGFPALFVVRPDGTISYSHVGLVDAEALEAAVAEAREGA